MTKNTNQIIIATIFIIAAFFGFKVFFVDNNTDPTLVAQKASVNQSFAEGQIILALISKLNNVKLDSSVFMDKVFVSLIDFERPITEQIPGRPNPFQPIGIDTSGVYVPSATSTLRVR